MTTECIDRMVRRGQQQKKALRKARNQLEAQLSSERGDYRADRAACRVGKPWHQTGDSANTVRLEHHTWRLGSKLADFVINAQVLTAEGWVTVEYIDCCHGYCHHHPQSGGEPRAIKRLDSIEDVTKAFSEAQRIIYDRLRIIRG